MVTGGDYTDTTETKEIGEGKKWTVLKTGNLVGISTGKISEMRLININNVVFSFGKNNSWSYCSFLWAFQTLERPRRDA